MELGKEVLWEGEKAGRCRVWGVQMALWQRQKVAGRLLAP